MANAVHIRDRNIALSSHLIGQFVKLSSGNAGTLKVSFHASHL